MGWQMAVASALGQHLANKSNIKQAAGQTAFQERMSNTAYQRAMADMRAAGLNPILAGKLGPASTPSGARAQIGNIGAAMSQGYQQQASAEGSIASAKQSLAQVEKIQAEAKQIVQTTGFQATIHKERWSKLFAGMSSENVLASVFASLSGVDIQGVLQGRAITVHQRENLEAFVRYVQSNKSALTTTRQGAEELGKRLGQIFNNFAEIYLK